VAYIGDTPVKKESLQRKIDRVKKERRFYHLLGILYQISLESSFFRER